VGEYLATLGWEHITLTGTYRYRWDLTVTSTLENLLNDSPVVAFERRDIPSSFRVPELFARTLPYRIPRMVSTRD